MRRTPWLPILFAAGVVVILSFAATWTVWRLERSLERELGDRLLAVAEGASAVIDPGDLVELQIEGVEGLAYGRILVDLEVVRRVGKSANVFLISPDGTVLLDLLHEDSVGEPSLLFSVERVAATTALAGQATSTRLYQTGDLLFKTGFAPIRTADDEVLGVVGIEAGVDFLGILRETRQNLLLTLLPAILAVSLLSAFFVRLSLSRQRLEREYARAENLAAVGELAATLAHEVRNPLGVIKRSAERLKRRYDGPESELLEYITEECDRLAGTVRRYLDFAKPAPPGEVGGKIDETVRATAALLERECEDRRVDLQIEVKGDGPWEVAIGTEELKQILLNLMRNSLEAFAFQEGEAPEGSLPAVVATERQRFVRVSLETVRNGTQLRFADNGPGMSEDTLRRAREPFYTTRAKGSGLGLAITDRLVRESGGEMRVQSELGKGTVIHLWMKRRSGNRG